MPKFTITQSGRKVGQVSAGGDRIEMGSAPGCPVQIDDLAIALKQAAFIREKAGEKYRVEPLSRLTAFKLNGAQVDAPMPVNDGATITIEGYEVRIEYLPDEKPPEPIPVPSAEPSLARGSVQPAPISEPPLPPPLDLESSKPPRPVSEQTAPPIAPAAPPSARPDTEKTVFVRRVGRLVATAGPLKGKRWDLISGETRIGRDPAQNHVVIRLDSQGLVDNSISRRHASVHALGDKLFVEDQKSAAGTFINGRPAPPGQKVEVRPGDVIEIRSAKESTYLTVESDRPTAPPPPPSAPTPPVLHHEEPARAEFEPVAPPRYEPSPPPFDEEEPPVPRRKSAAEAFDDNPFLPMEERQGPASWPRWVWGVAGAALLVLIVVLVLVLS